VTAKQPRRELDAYATIKHAAELGMNYQDYIAEVMFVARKKLKKLTEKMQ
jgi:predicted DNA binding CopG/RHH family protein